jgi:glutamine synthetase
MKHGHALMAFCAPTTNSYKRLVPGYEAPVNLVMSQRNRSAACRIPMYWTSPGARRVEFRCPDPSANPYLAFAAMMMAGLDGIKNKIDPGQPVDKNIFELPASEAKKIKQVPSSLEQSLAALEDDHDFLTQGDVFTQDVIDTWIDYKRKKEIDPVRLRPHPWEFYQYFDI